MILTARAVVQRHERRMRCADNTRTCVCMRVQRTQCASCLGLSEVLQTNVHGCYRVFFFCSFFVGVGISQCVKVEYSYTVIHDMKELERCFAVNHRYISTADMAPDS